MESICADNIRQAVQLAESRTSRSSSELQILLDERETVVTTSTTPEALADNNTDHKANVLSDSCSNIRTEHVDLSFPDQASFHSYYTSTPAKDCLVHYVNPSKLETKLNSDGPMNMQVSAFRQDDSRVSQNNSTVSHIETISNQDAQPIRENVITDEMSLEDRRADSSFMEYSRRIDLESILVALICDDNVDGLINALRDMVKLRPEELDHEIDNKKIVQSQYSQERSANCIIDFWFPHRLLHLACSLDSVACAKAIIEGQITFSGLSNISSSSSSVINAVDEHGRSALHHAAEKLSLRCIDLLLRKNAKTELRATYSADHGFYYTPLEAALHNKRWQKEWQKLPAKEIISTLKNQDLKSVNLLASHTRDTLNLAYQLAIDGRDSIALTAFLLASGKALLSEGNRYDNFIGMIVDKLLNSSSKENTSNISSRDMSNTNTPAMYKDEEERRSLILKNLEITVLLKKEIEGSSAHLTPELTSWKDVPPILRAAQAGDEMIVRILLNDATCINAMDSDGNTALHLCLRAHINATKVSGIVWQLIRHGSSVNARNRLGLTPVHIAAGHGHVQSLQLLLAQEPDTAHIAAETRETPLFLAVKNNHIECAKLLLQFGSNPQALNLRRQRPIDFANSEAMRTILSHNPKYTSGMIQGSSTEWISSTMDTVERGLQKVTNYTKVDKLTLASQDVQDEDSKICLQRTQAKTVLCRYHALPGGCSRGDACLYAHGEQELRSNTVHEKAKSVDVASNKKIFVGGLPLTIGSDELKESFQDKFGPVSEAAVMGSQSGNQVMSRGFGFVTFKNQSSYFEAVRQHFIILFGKKVEIKAAMQLSTTSTDEELLQMHLPNSSKETEQKAGLDLDALKWNNIPATTTNASMIKGNSPRWLKVFKKWFPVFLNAIHQRQQRGESYPLSSVKADFRATCGMELDHAALGYPKLSDFLRTMPHVCQMKIVPVGRGPATHVILTQPSCQRQNQMASSKVTFPNRILSTSMVHQGRTYAAAVGSGSDIDQSSIINQKITNSVDSNFNNTTTTGISAEQVLADQGLGSDNARDIFSNKISTMSTSNGGPKCIDTRAEELIIRQTCNNQEIRQMQADLEKYYSFPSLDSVNSNVNNRSTKQVLAQGLDNEHPQDVYSCNLNKISLFNATQNCMVDGRAEDLIITHTSNHQKRPVLDDQVEKYSTLIDSVNSNLHKSVREEVLARNFSEDNLQDLLFTLDKMHPSNTEHGGLPDHVTADDLMIRTYNRQRPNMQDYDDYPLFSILDEEYTENQYIKSAPQTMYTTVDTINSWNQASAGNKVTCHDKAQYIPTCLYNQQICMLGGNNIADLSSRVNYVSQTNDPSEVAFLTHASLHHGTSPSFRHLNANSSQSESKNYQAMQISNLLDYIRPSYNPWNSNTFPGCKNLIQQMNMTAGNIHTSEESSHESTLTSEDSLDSPTQSVSKQYPYSTEGHEWMAKY